jgi:hypothetical protein
VRWALAKDKAYCRVVVYISLLPLAYGYLFDIPSKFIAKNTKPLSEITWNSGFALPR